ncbi:MAG TPA: hypothetical protein VIT65_10050 [Microlunatus sp.]
MHKPVRQETPHYAPTVRSALAVAAAILADFCLLYGLSFPGFPFWAAGWGMIAAATSATLVVASGIRALVIGRSKGRSALTLFLVALLLTAGVAVAKHDDGTRMAARWTASQAAFESEVQTAGPVPVMEKYDSGHFSRYPGTCPAAIGKFRIIECHTIDGGYLYLQAQGAITDDSGIVYLPADAESQWRTTERMTSLGEPWWSWTCHC